MNATELAAEITNDPSSLGYGDYVTGGTEILQPNYAAAIAEKLNAKMGAGADLVSVGLMTKNEFLLSVVAPIVPTLLGLQSESQALWQQYLNLATSATTIDVGSPIIQSLLAQMVQQSLTTQEAIDAATKRPGTRAEVLFGPGAVVWPHDVIMAVTGESGWTSTVISVTQDGPSCRVVVQFAKGEVTSTEMMQTTNYSQSSLRDWAAARIAALNNRDAAEIHLATLVNTTL